MTLDTSFVSTLGTRRSFDAIWRGATLPRHVEPRHAEPHPPFADPLRLVGPQTQDCFYWDNLPKSPLTKRVLSNMMPTPVLRIARNSL